MLALWLLDNSESKSSQQVGRCICIKGFSLSSICQVESVGSEPMDDDNILCRCWPLLVKMLSADFQAAFHTHCICIRNQKRVSKAVR